ncbi:MAG: hypothetical protein K2M07_02880 [Muribaculaceae bacterium]|nr:hypothetical protein [Muribaculaceae bacterium]
MNRLKLIINIIILLYLPVALAGCRDDELGSFGNSDGPEVMVDLEASFSPFAGGGLSRSSNVAPARGFNTVSDLAILTFSAADEKLLDAFEPRYFDVKDEGRTDADASNQSTAETDTKSVSNISVRIPQGTYYIVAVANYGEYNRLEDGTIATTKTSLEKLRENSSFKVGEFTLSDLRALRVGWDTEEYANNRAMLGYFTVPGASVPYAGSKFETVTVNKPNMRLKAWLRRCASKITVDFDGSSLSENISIFIKDVRICDLAGDCSLGFGNPSTNDENAVDFNNHPDNEDSLISSDGTYIEIGKGEYYPEWPCITKENPYILDDDGLTRKDLHTQDSDCLYFYENMQGVREGYDRTPVPNLIQGGVAEGFNVKDGVPYGTFVEVTAHYVSEVNNQSREQDIKYRFMLGKNVTDNFDAERNYHYKLTLKFMGNANEYHWHIDYTREEGFKVPNPWYVSYVYNHDAYLPFEFDISEDWEIVDMNAKIVTNPWYPTTSSASGEGFDSELVDPDYVITPETPAGDEDYPYQTADNKYTGNGFLSLRAPSGETVLTDRRAGVVWSGYGTAGANQLNQKYFDGVSAGVDSDGNPVAPVNHGERVIIKDTHPVTDGTEREKISVKRQSDNYSINIPLFTREKSLIKQTGYTGNNPFVGYQRVAKIELTATVRNKSDHNQTRDFTSRVNVVQVRRVVNPKGVYRSSGNYEPFHVNLKYLTSEGADGVFTSIISRGPWMAEILGDGNFITIDGKQRVNGSSRSQIDFDIRFNRMAGAGNKNAIIRIKYHNYTCTHLIFVRQGYAPQVLCDGGPIFNNPHASPTSWNTFNMIAGNKMADDPRDEGSMFKYGGAERAISSVDNIYKDEEGNPIFSEQVRTGFKPHETMTLLDSEGNVIENLNKWTDVTMNTAGFGGAKNDDNTPMEISRAATMRDYEQLYLTKHIEFGYGVLYADGATTTQSSIEMVNGWYRDDPSADKNKKGMRGMFVYYWDSDNPNNQYNARNMFLPLGRSGYGHRKNAREEKNEGYNGKGILRYAVSRVVPANEYGGVYSNFQNVSPLFEFLYRRMGAIYWARTQTPIGGYLVWNGETEIANSGAGGVDINYFSFDVNAININVLDNGRDACFVRTVASSAGE